MTLTHTLLLIVALQAVETTAPAKSPAPADSVKASARPKAIAWRRNIQEAKAAALDEDRLLVVFVTSGKCKFCTKMKRSTLANAGVIAEIDAHFVAVAGDAQGAALVAKPRVTAFPTTLLLAPDGKVLDRIKGYVSASELKQRLSVAHRRVSAATQLASKPSTADASQETAASAAPSAEASAALLPSAEAFPAETSAAQASTAGQAVEPGAARDSTAAPAPPPVEKLAAAPKKTSRRPKSKR